MGTFVDASRFLDWAANSPWAAVVVVAAIGFWWLDKRFDAVEARLSHIETFLRMQS